MAQNPRKWVVFRTNATVPASVLDAYKDQKMQVGKPVKLPATYADHVVHEGFADFCYAPEKDGSQKPAPKKDVARKGTDRSPDEKAAAEATAKLEAAQARVDNLNAKLGEMSEGDEGWEDLTKELDEAVAELAALQPAS